MKQAIRQAITLMKQHKLYTTIYVAGTALSITLTMVMLLILYVKFGPIYPEKNRNRILVVNTMIVKEKASGQIVAIADGFNEAFLYHLNTKTTQAEAIAARGFPQKKELLLPDGTVKEQAGYVCNADYWRVFNFRFVHGRPFNNEEMESNQLVALVSTNLAKELFATTDAVGQRINFDHTEYRVIGVFEPAMSVSASSTGDLFVPIPYHPEQLNLNTVDMGGGLQFYLLPKDGKREALRQEVIDMVARLSQNDEEISGELCGQPEPYWKNEFRTWGEDTPNTTAPILKFGLILLALLFIPAINLCGMMSSRMDERQEEMGVRKAFGATNRQLIVQTLNENLLLTAIGAIIGLLTAYALVLLGSDRLLWMFNNRFGSYFRSLDATVDVSMSVLFNPFVLGCIVLLTLLLNVISALIPTIMALRKPIVWSLNKHAL